MVNVNYFDHIGPYILIRAWGQYRYSRLCLPCPLGSKNRKYNHNKSHMSKMNNLFRYIKWCSLTSFVDFIQPFMTTLSAVTDDRSLYWVYWNHVRPSPESQPETSSLESHLSDFFLIMISWNEIFFLLRFKKVCRHLEFFETVLSLKLQLF